jgi:hypothetical protein
MFYFDAIAVQRFLASAGVEAGNSSAEAAGATGAGRFAVASDEY